MPLFRQGNDPAEEEAAQARQQARQQATNDHARAMFEWASGAPAGDLAAELMPAFGPDGPKRGQLDLGNLTNWLSGYPPALRLLRGPMLEAMQLLEDANLVYIDNISDAGSRSWSATRFGLATLANGKAAVRQRIKDRTAL